jgi:hypothetical protein
MANLPNQTKYAGKTPVFWTEPSKVEVFGYKLSQSFPKGTVIAQGTPIYADLSNGTAKICKIGKVVAKETTTKFHIAKGSLFAAGDKIMMSNSGGAATLSTISSIDKSNADYDLMTLSAANSQLAAGSIIVEGATTDGNTAPVVLPNRLVARECVVNGIADTISACYNVVAIENTINIPVEYLNTTAFPGSKLLIGCPTISFIKQ